MRAQAPGAAPHPCPTAAPLTSKPPMMISPWMPKLLMLALISSKYFLGKVLAEAWWRGGGSKTSGGGLCPGPHTRVCTGRRYLFVPSLEPPSPVQPPTLSQLISSTWGGEAKHKNWGAGRGEKKEEESFGARRPHCAGRAPILGYPRARLQGEPHPWGLQVWGLHPSPVHPLSPPHFLTHLPKSEPLEAVVHRQHAVPVDEADPHGGAHGRVHAGSRGAHVEHSQRVAALGGARRWF